ncbi:MAG TPA: DUF2269 family protein [Candidatus Saccharimonadales bacterium]|nr:DUF2269 family protein [Candidatus Saccharimonadales bacterium]
MYQALVLVHLVGVVVFALAHGVSIFAAFRVRGETDPKIVAAVLGMSKSAVLLLYVGLILLGIGGFGAAWQADLLLAPWAIASYVAIVIVFGVMMTVGTPYYVRVRSLVGPHGEGAPDPEVLRQTLATRRPEVLVTVGSIGLLVILWLMVVKPS